MWLPARIRRAMAALTDKLRHIHDPLTQLRLYVDGKKIRVEVEGKAMEAESGQLLLDFDPVEFNRLLEFRGRDNGQAEREKKAEAERWFQRGLELEQTGAAAEEVIEAYKKSLELDPSSAGALVNLGTIYFNARDYRSFTSTSICSVFSLIWASSSGFGIHRRRWRSPAAAELARPFFVVELASSPEPPAAR